MDVCKHCHQPVMMFEFKDGSQWWHADPDSSRVTYRHCRNDVHAPVAEPLRFLAEDANA